MSMTAIGIVMGAKVDTLRAADVPNGLIHVFLNRLEDGYARVLHGDGLGIMFEFLDVLRSKVASND